jgi:plasmid stabilization system protein ParE
MPPEGYNEMWETIRAGEVWRGEFHNRKKSGELYWEAASISPIRDSEGSITHFLAVKEDVTERKRAEKELATTVDELQRFNQLTVGREERMIELKREVNEMARKAGIAPPYDSALVEGGRTAAGRAVP